MIIAIHISLNFPFSVFGGIISGFQRYDANNMVAIATSIAVAVVNAVVLTAGYGLVTLVAATTCVRIVAYFVYRNNAYRIFPELAIRLSLFRRSRLREVTGFSVYSSVIDWANKLNYQLDQLVIGAFLGSSAVAVWAPAERIITGTQRLTNQLNGVLFPVIVDSDASQQKQRLQQILLQGTRLSLVMVVPIAAALILLADPLIHAWLGPKKAPAMAGAVPIIQILAVAVAIRVGNATGNTVLKGAGEHRMLAFVNLGTGVANMALSILLIHRYGLVGVAVGTLIPIAFTAFFILYPASCRRVGLPVTEALTQAVLPAVWPAFVVAVALGEPGSSHPARFWLWCCRQWGEGCCTSRCSIPSRSGATIGRCTRRKRWNSWDGDGSPQRFEPAPQQPAKSIGRQQHAWSDSGGRAGLTAERGGERLAQMPGRSGRNHARRTPDWGTATRRDRRDYGRGRLPGRPRTPAPVGMGLPMLRTPSTPRPTACTRCGWHDLCCMRGSWS